MDDEHLSSTQKADQLIAKTKLEELNNNELPSQVSQDLKSNIELGAAGEHTQDRWLAGILFSGFNKRSGVGKLVYVVVAILVLFVLGWVINKLTATDTSTGLF